MIFPKPLVKGDKVGITAPARKILPADLDAAARILKNWGLQPVFSRFINSASHSYLAGTDSERLADLQSMIDDREIKAIICARGGYGSTRIIDNLNIIALRENPKWLIGFSDITALHLLLEKNEIASIHGTMPILFSGLDAAPSVNSLRSVLFESSCNIHWPASQFNREGRACAETVGGNLSLLADSLGTKTEISTAGKILILEEIDEYLYKVDRMMTQLRRAGKLSELKGLIIGHMTDIKDTTLPFGQSVEEIILNAVKDSSCPVAFRFPSGHEDPNLAWIHGGTAILDVTSSGGSVDYRSPTS